MNFNSIGKPLSSGDTRTELVQKVCERQCVPAQPLPALPDPPTLTKIEPQTEPEEGDSSPDEEIPNPEGGQSVNEKAAEITAQIFTMKGLQGMLSSHGCRGTFEMSAWRTRNTTNYHLASGKKSALIG